MVLADTSVWIDFFHGGGTTARLSSLLEEGQVLMHPWTLGELALSNLGRRREQILADLKHLPTVRPISNEEVLALIEARSLAGRDIDWVGAHLLGSALVSSAGLWTLDQRLAGAASDCGVFYGT